MQHELDHVDGVLFLDRVDSLVDDVFRRRVSAPDQSTSGGRAGSSNASPGARMG